MVQSAVPLCQRVAVVSDFIFSGDQSTGLTHLIELRLDCLRNTDLQVLCSQLLRAREYYGHDRPFIVTLRHPTQYGYWPGNEAQRLDCYLALLPHAEYIDVEADSEIAPALATAVAEQKKHLIVSWHGPLGVRDYRELRAIASALGAKYCKMAAETLTLDDVMRLADMMPDDIQESPQPVLMGMATEGALTRVLLPWMGSRLVYGFNAQPAVVTGQISLSLINQCLALCEQHQTDIDALLQAMLSLHQSAEYTGSVSWSTLERRVRAYAIGRTTLS